MGRVRQVSCSIQAATRIEWLNNGRVLVNTLGNVSTVAITVNDSIHNEVFMCKGYNETSIVGGLNVTILVNGELM